MTAIQRAITSYSYNNKIFCTKKAIARCYFTIGIALFAYLIFYNINTYAAGKKPVINLNGSSNIAVNVGDSYKDQGASAKDSSGNDISNDINVINSVDTSEPGDYNVTYRVKDSYGNISDTVTRRVRVKGIGSIIGRDRIETSLAIAKACYNGKVSGVVLTTAEKYPDAISGSILAYKFDAPILMVGSSDADQQKVLDYMKKNLDFSGTVYLLGGTGAVSELMEKKVNDAGFKNIKRFGGIDRYETSVKIAEAVNIPTGSPIILASGEGYPEALLVSSAAAVNQYPIILTQGDKIPDSVKDEILKIRPTRVYLAIFGKIICDRVEKEVSDITSLDNSNIIKVSGKNSFDNFVQEQRNFNMPTSTICVVVFGKFSDALSGSLYAAKKNEPILISDSFLTDEQINYLKNYNISGMTLFGEKKDLSIYIQREFSEIMKN